ncbi:MAG: Crp/Fnr family transcriptional regulator [Clostridiales bacterium 38-18]|nr:MAG: Crp/Fnr family transcriptional regulator [Clostridiales bacterium 38-18]
MGIYDLDRKLRSDLDENALSELLKQFLPFWSNLTSTEQHKLINNTYNVSYKKGEMIHGGESDCIGILLIRTGGLRTYILSEDGREVTLYRLAPNDVCVLSSSCVLSNITFDVHIDADFDSELLIINSDIYSELAATNVHVENFTNKEAVARFSDVMWAMQQILFMSFDKRLASFLLDEISRNGSVEILMTHDQIAKYVGSAREVVSRMLKYFAAEGIVTMQRGGVIVNDKASLREIVGLF